MQVTGFACPERKMPARMMGKVRAEFPTCSPRISHKPSKPTICHVIARLCPSDINPAGRANSPKHFQQNPGSGFLAGLGPSDINPTGRAQSRYRTAADFCPTGLSHDPARLTSTQRAGHGVDTNCAWKATGMLSKPAQNKIPNDTMPNPKPLSNQG